jgi:hypothetical protein
MALACPYFQHLVSLKSRDAVLGDDKDKIVKQERWRVAEAGAPGDPWHGLPKYQVPRSLQTGRHPALHVSFGANCQWIR